MTTSRNGGDELPTIPTRVIDIKATENPGRASKKNIDRLTMSHRNRQGPCLAFAEFKFPPANAEPEGP